MFKIIIASPKLILAMMLRQIALQEELLECKRENIELRKQLKALTPVNPKGDEWSWHKTHDMVQAEAAAGSDELQKVRQYNDWLTWFGEKFLKPYVHARVYMEAMSHMRRGLASRLAELETREDMKRFRQLDLEQVEAMRRAKQQKRPPASVN